MKTTLVATKNELKDAVGLPKEGNTPPALQGLWTALDEALRACGYYAVENDTTLIAVESVYVALHDIADPDGIWSAYVAEAADRATKRLLALLAKEAVK